MKKKPSQIFSILLNVLNNLNLKENYSINEISEISGLHWNTTKEYIDLLIHILKFAPQIKLDENNKVQIRQHSKIFDDLTLNQKILVSLYENKAFNENSAINLKELFQVENLDNYLEDLTVKEQIIQVNNKDQYFITKRGKMMVIELFSEITSSIFTESGKDKQIESELDTKSYLKTIVRQNNLMINEIKSLETQNNSLNELLKESYSNKTQLINPFLIRELRNISPIYQNRAEFEKFSSNDEVSPQLHKDPKEENTFEELKLMPGG